MPSSADLLRRALLLVPSQRGLADKLEMTPSRLSRVVKGGRLSVEKCLALAELLQEYPHLVLRAYGYEREAGILERSYPQAGLGPKPRRLLGDLLAALTAVLDEQARVEQHTKPATPRRRAKR